MYKHAAATALLSTAVNSEARLTVTAVATMPTRMVEVIRGTCHQHIPPERDNKQPASITGDFVAVTLL
jgi:hypothetical protein